MFCVEKQLLMRCGEGPSPISTDGAISHKSGGYYPSTPTVGIMHIIVYDYNHVV